MPDEMTPERFAQVCFEAEECAKGYVPRWDLLPAETQAILINGAASAMEQLQRNRWAAFTDDELEALADDFDPGLGIGARCAPDGSVMAELVAEIERRQS